MTVLGKTYYIKKLKLAIKCKFSLTFAGSLEVVDPVSEIVHDELLGLDHLGLVLHRLLEVLVLLADRSTPVQISNK